MRVREHCLHAGRFQAIVWQRRAQLILYTNPIGILMYKSRIVQTLNRLALCQFINKQSRLFYDLFQNYLYYGDKTYNIISSIALE